MIDSSGRSVIVALREGFAEDLFVTDPELMASYARDRTGNYVGMPLSVARPRSAKELFGHLFVAAELWASA